MKITPVSLNFQANKMSKKQARFFRNKLKNSESVDIICHESTDRDALGSALALQGYLNKKGVNSRIILSQNLEKIGVKNPDFNYIQACDFKQDDRASTVFCVDFSSDNRINSNVLNYIKNKNDVLCIDHHSNPNLFEKDVMVLKRHLRNAQKDFETSVSAYIDTTAKSATSIVYRFFEANKEPISSDIAYNLMLGFVDDGAKRGMVRYDGKKGTIDATDGLKKDKNAYEIYLKLKKKLNKEQIKKIAQNVDIMSNLTLEEQRFYDSLYQNLKFSKNGKIAYVEIPPNSEQWRILGADNSRTSSILNRFRQNVLNNNFNDKRLSKVELVLTFYEAQGAYRLSAHCKKPTLLDFYRYIEKTSIPDFTNNSGGHPNRGGGRLLSTNPDVCHKWVEDIISCDNFYG